MAARQYLAMALRLGVGEARQQRVVELLELDSDPLSVPARAAARRSRATPATRPTARRSPRRSGSRPSAVTRRRPRSFPTRPPAIPRRADLWHLIALLRAWDGPDAAAAAEAFRKAAELYGDESFAAEMRDDRRNCCRGSSPSRSFAVRQVVYRVESVGRLLSQLDGVPGSTGSAHRGAQEGSRPPTWSSTARCRGPPTRLRGSTTSRGSSAASTSTTSRSWDRRRRDGVPGAGRFRH